MNHRVTVIGAGMVGVCCALALQEQGFQVTLIDKREPGEETSFGNSGVVTPSSLMPLNNPALFAALPKLLRNNQASLRYNPKFLLANPRFAIGFLRNAKQELFEETAEALHGLISLSRDEHARLSMAAGAQGHWRDTGWLMLYRNEAAFSASALARSTYAHHGVDVEILDGDQIERLEPTLTLKYHSGILVRQARSVDSPSKVVKAYAALFVQRGGVFQQRELTSLRALLNQGDEVVLAAGPWSIAMLNELGLTFPMGFERGYHRHFASSSRLGRPIYDSGGGFVLSPMLQGLRLTTGVELTAHLAPSNYAQLRLAEVAARAAIHLGEATSDPIWRGARPTLPDSRPVVGKLAAHARLWGAFGHQHIGFSTGAGTGLLLADQMAHQIFGKREIYSKISRYFYSSRL